MNIDERKLQETNSNLVIMLREVKEVIQRNVTNRVELKDIVRLQTMAETVNRNVIDIINSYSATQAYRIGGETSDISQLNGVRVFTHILPENVVVIKICERAPLRHDTYTKNNWLSYMNYAVNLLRQKCNLPYYNKAFVLINIHHPLVKLHDKFDCDNVLVQPILNKIKGNFCKDDSRGYMCYMVMSTIDEDSYISIKVCEISSAANLLDNSLISENT